MTWQEYLDLETLIALRWPNSPALTIEAADAIRRQGFKDLGPFDLQDAMAALDGYHADGNIFPPPTSQLRARAAKCHAARLDEERRKRPQLPESVDRRAGLVGFAEDHEGRTPGEELQRLIETSQ